MTGLDRFPENGTAQRMLSRVSPVYADAYVAKWLFEVLGREWDAARGCTEELHLQLFPETATWGLRYWEQRYQIPVDESAPLEERRRQVLIRRGIRSPMNPARVEQIAGSIIGVPVEVRENIAPYTFGMYFDHGGAAFIDLEKLVQTVRRAKPSHLSVYIRANLYMQPCQIRAACALSCAARTVLRPRPQYFPCVSAIRAGCKVRGVPRTIIYPKGV